MDVYDDADGATVRTVFHDGRFPESVKVAHALSHEDRAALPDDLFALVLTEGDDVVLRKYACVDRGNTELSVLYFLDHGHKLAEHVQEQTARNLVTACGWYDIEVPPVLEKVAFGLRSALSLAAVPSVVGGVGGQAKRNLATVRAGERMGGVSGGIGALAEGKLAEVIGTDIMPTSCDTSAKVKKDDIPIKKSARMESVGVGPGEKTAARATVVSALNGRYPLDNYSDVKTAADYFERHARKLPVMDRRDFAVSLVKRASELNISCGELATAYSGEKRASDDTWEAAFQSRQEHVRSDRQLSALLEKVAEQREEVSPDVFAQLLLEFDKMAGLQYHYDLTVVDPALSAYAPRGQDLDKVAGDDDYLDTSTGRSITGEDIKRFAAAHRDYATGMFGEDVADKLQKDPIGTYAGMPSSRRQVLANMIAEFAGSGRA